MPYRVPERILGETFGNLRWCGKGHRECQALWISAWDDISNIAAVVHPRHNASPVGFDLEGEWIDEFWDRLSATSSGIRVQVHTHPGAAFHSATDDAFPIIHSSGFLSLVIPNFALGPIGFEGAYLAEFQKGRTWKQVPTDEYFEVV